MWNYIPSKLSGLEKAEITQAALKDNECFIAEENAKSCFWAGITLHSSRDCEASWLASSLVTSGAIPGGWWVVDKSAVCPSSTQAVVPGSVSKHNQQVLPSLPSPPCEGAWGELQPVWSPPLKKFPDVLSGVQQSYQSGREAGEHLRLCRVRLRELGLSSIKKRWVMGGLTVVFPTWDTQRRWSQTLLRGVQWKEATDWKKQRKLWLKSRHLGKWLG